MDFPRIYQLREIARFLDCEFEGSENFPIKGMNEIHLVRPGDIVFVNHPKYYKKALNSAATIILIDKKVACPVGKALLISKDPFRDFNKLTERFRPFRQANSSIAESARVGESTIIQPGVFVGHGVSIGENCIIHSNVSIYDDCVIGNNVTIHAGAILGANAFYYRKLPQRYDRLKSGGRVVVEDDVDIGALTTIDRGVSGDTVIGKGSKLDNQVQIGHDTKIGENCLIASQTGIAGCVVVEDNVVIWGQVGCASGVNIGANVVLYAKTGVTKSIPSGKKFYWGVPATEASQKLKEMACVRGLPELMKGLKNYREK